jgi:hypothetical protein
MACWTCTSASAPSIGARTLDALKPFTLDAGSFETLPELLEKNGGYEPTAVAPFESKESESCGYEPFCYAD